MDNIEDVVIQQAFDDLRNALSKKEKKVINLENKIKEADKKRKKLKRKPMSLKKKKRKL